VGNGTFNLTAIYRALGIKNPEPEIRETVQPVLLVGDMRFLTPQHRPPSGAFGGNISAVVGEFAAIQVTARAAGGCLVPMLQEASTLRYSTLFDRESQLTLATAGAQFSRDPLVSQVFTGNITAKPLGDGVAPAVNSTVFQAWPNTTDFKLFIPAGGRILFWHPTSNQAINAWSINVVDIPASEHPPS
jgi:hypothetical protein